MGIRRTLCMSTVVLVIIIGLTQQIAEEYGVVSPVNSNHNAVHARRENSTRADEHVKISFIEQAVKPGDFVLEIGSQMGRSSTSSIVNAVSPGSAGRPASAEAEAEARKELVARNAASLKADAVASNVTDAAPARKELVARNAASLKADAVASNVTDAAPAQATGAPAAKLGRDRVNPRSLQPRGNSYEVLTSSPQSFRHLNPHVLVVDCDGCFDVELMTALGGARTFLNVTRTIVMENDSADAPRQAQMHALLAALGYHSTVCVSHPVEKGADPYFHGCFWNVLQRTAKYTRTVRVLRADGETFAAFCARVESLTQGAVVQEPLPRPLLPPPGAVTTTTTIMAATTTMTTATTTTTIASPDMRPDPHKMVPVM